MELEISKKDKSLIYQQKILHFFINHCDLAGRTENYFYYCGLGTEMTKSISRACKVSSMDKRREWLKLKQKPTCTLPIWKYDEYHLSSSFNWYPIED